jgi:FlaA1/EpsC-like NDP-sugar epimerase
MKSTNFARWLHASGTFLVGLGRRKKRALLIVNDLVLLSVVVWGLISARYWTPFVPPTTGFAVLLLLAPVLSIAAMFQMDLYRLVTRYMGTRRAIRFPAALTFAVLVWALVIFLTGVPGIPRTLPFAYVALGSFALWGSRVIAGRVLAHAGAPAPTRDLEMLKPVLVYGAGPTAALLVESLYRSGTYNPVALIDRSPTLWGQYVSGLRVSKPERLGMLIERHGIAEVIVAIPDSDRRLRLEVLRELQAYSVTVRLLPGMDDIVDGRITFSDIRPIKAEDLLGREPAPSRGELIARNTRDKTVMVTGAGGTIGSELVRQVLRQGPRRLILLDIAETALYLIDREVQRWFKAQEAAVAARKEEWAFTPPEVVVVLGSAADAAMVQALLTKYKVETIYHAAAYKHVPIVEHNPVAGLRNNTLGTAALTEVAARCGVESFVLVSTDKAVRPTSVMGASKRLAEMILQARAADPTTKTVFTMVRFGNVLDSSGSVMQLFREQIETGGPITVTHPNMIRYFMSIPEAASLVIQAGAMAKGGEVFVLDMGEPVRIDDMVRSMARMMGRRVIDEATPDGDIAIEYIGLRPGEKLYEELLIGDNTSGTEHPRIMQSHEPMLPMADLKRELVALNDALTAGDIRAIHTLLSRVVEGYHPETRHLDPQWSEDNRPDAPVQSRALH